MAMTETYWVISVLLMVLGVAGTVLPVLPGTAFVFAGAWLGAWIDAYSRVSVTTVVVLAVLAAVAFVLDYVAASMGAKKAGASKLAVIGAAVGTILGLTMGFVGVLFMPFVGAAVGEYLDQRNHQRALNVGLATWVAMILGMVVKVTIVFMMIGIFCFALWWG